jgi:hypothetical protein
MKKHILFHSLYSCFISATLFGLSLKIVWYTIVLCRGIIRVRLHREQKKVPFPSLVFGWDEE